MQKSATSWIVLWDTSVEQLAKSESCLMDDLLGYAGSNACGGGAGLEGMVVMSHEC